jgi:hypothetical protein
MSSERYLRGRSKSIASGLATPRDPGAKGDDIAQTGIREPPAAVITQEALAAHRRKRLNNRYSGLRVDYLSVGDLTADLAIHERIHGANGG